MNSLKNLHIQPSDIFDTYNRVPTALSSTIVNDYFSGEIIDIEKRKYLDSSKAHWLKGIKQLEQNNLLPLDIDNKKLINLNLLMSIINARGAGALEGGEKSSSTNPRYNLTAVNEQQRKLLNQLISSLDESFVPDSTSNLFKLNASLSRLISLLIPFGKDNKKNNPLPEYIEVAWNDIQNIDANQTVKNTSCQIVRDSIFALLYTRLIKRDYEHDCFVARLFDMNSDEKSTKYQDKIIKMAKFSFPNLNFHTRKGNSLAELVVTGEKIEIDNIQLAFQQRVEEVVQLTQDEI